MPVAFGTPWSFLNLVANHLSSTTIPRYIEKLGISSHLPYCCKTVYLPSWHLNPWNCQTKTLSALHLQIFRMCLSHHMFTVVSGDIIVFKFLLVLVQSTVKQEMHASYWHQKMLHSTSYKKVFYVKGKSISYRSFPALTDSSQWKQNTF